MLAVQRLTKLYGALASIRDVSFEARPGEVLGLIGPNGSGKSTTVVSSELPAAWSIRSNGPEHTRAARGAVGS